MQIKKNDWAFDICNWPRPGCKNLTAIYVIKLDYAHLDEPSICNTEKKYQHVYKTTYTGPRNPGIWQYEFIMRQL